MKRLAWIILVGGAASLAGPDLFCPPKEPGRGPAFADALARPAQNASRALPVSRNPFGVMLPKSFPHSPGSQAVAQDLGGTYFRPSQAVFINQWNGRCPSCEAALASGFKLVLTVSAFGGQARPSSPPADMEAYRGILAEILETFRPVLLAVENEENSSVFYTGTPEQYGEELAAACRVAHAQGIPCTNGGMVSTLVALLVWNHYRENGADAQARDFAARAFDPEMQSRLESPQAAAQIEKGKALLAVYKASDIDYLNFHWYIADTTALKEAAAFLEAQTGRPVISNEVGQVNDDPGQTAAVMRTLAELRIPIAVWFGMDGPKARGLVNPDGTLRPTGWAFKTFILQNFPTR